jgi:hypothetical protein
VPKLFSVLTFVLAFGFPRGALAQQSIRVHCGGGSYTDSKGRFGKLTQATTGEM